MTHHSRQCDSFCRPSAITLDILHVSMPAECSLAVAYQPVLYTMMRQYCSEGDIYIIYKSVS